MSLVTPPPYKLWKDARWIFDSYLLQPADEGDRHVFADLERRLEAMYQECLQERYAQAYQLWQLVTLDLLAPASTPQLARYYFLGTELALALEKWKDAFDHASSCSEHIPESDWISHVQLASKLGVAALYSKNYRPAADAYSTIIAHVDEGKQIRFIQGEWENFLANAYLQRAQAAHALGYFDQAQDDLSDAVALLNQWSAQNDLQAPLAPASDDVSPQTSLVPLKASTASEVLQHPDRSTKTWLELYAFIPWQIATTLLWEHKLDPAQFSLHVWRDAYQTVSAAAQNCEGRVGMLGYAADLHGFAAEIALTPCEHLAPIDWLPKLAAAEASLASADLIVHLQASTAPLSPVSQHLITLMHLFHAYWTAQLRYELTGKSEALVTLSVDVQDYIHRVRQEDFHHLEGRGYFLLGLLTDPLYEVPVMALAYYRRALALFEQAPEAFYPHRMETQRAIERILHEFPHLKD